MTSPSGFRRAGTTLAALAASVCLVAPMGAATCGPAAGIISTASVVFVGTLTTVDATGSQATFAVEEVWKGDDVPSEVTVSGSAGQWLPPNPAARYLVLAKAIGGTLRADGSECHQAYAWDNSMAVQRPATAHPPVGGSTDAGVEVPFEVLLFGGIVLLVAGISFVAFKGTGAAARASD